MRNLDVSTRIGGVALLVSIGGASHTAVAQPGPVYYPSVHGQWAGPWDLALDPNFNSNYHEFAHASVLPDDDPTVILWAQDQCSGVGFTETYLWQPRTPGQVTPAGGTSPTSQYTMFCSGHTWDANGKLIVAGGTDYVTGCPLSQSNTGHNRAWEFDPFATGGPSWSSTAGGMGKKRWYPTVVPLGDYPASRVLVLGHTGFPQDTPINQDEYFEFFDRLPGTFGGAFENRTVDLSNVCNPNRAPILDYPRVHQLVTGDVMWADGSYNASGPLCSGSGAVPITAFFDYTTNFNCSSAPTVERWRVNCQGSATFKVRDQTNSVHLTWPGSFFPDYEEVIYLIGGQTRVPLVPVASVEKMKDPTATKPWDESADDLERERYNSNTVIALDGSLIAIGGQGIASGGGTEPVLNAERIEPPEVFTSTTNVWKLMAPQSIGREYHSVAGLLPDGRIFSVGGEDEYAGAFGNPNHTIEIYSPPYLFQGRRPSIVSISPSLPDYNFGVPILVTFTVPTGRTFARAALVRHASVTHAFDASQRYVVLRETVPATSTTVTVALPPNGNVAPAGYYMLTIVDSAGVPSVATFLKLGTAP